MELFNEWLVFSLILLGIWFIIFSISKKFRKEMFLVSLFTMPFGLTEPLFVPEYWNPPSLFNLATITGLDIESFIFSFAIGGIGAVLYNIFFKVKRKKMDKYKMHSKMHRFHLISLLSPLFVFLIFYIFTELNPIYSASVAMFFGGVTTILCRPDLKKEVWMGGVLFFFLYFVFFLFFILIYPYAVTNFWNLSAISGILIFGIPIEELLFAFTYGMLWSSAYEHILWYNLKKLN